MPAISPTVNDGVVNAVRQIVNPGRREKVGGFVVADHGDVLGHYKRAMETMRRLHPDEVADKFPEVWLSEGT